MHYFGACVVPASTTYEEAGPYVEKAMAPHREDWSGEENRGFWDWYQIGGRWTGVWAEYDPSKDPRNIADGSQPYDQTRIGQVRWPTHWVPFGEDLKPVALFLAHPEVFRRPITLITPDGAIEREPWDGNEFGKHTDEEWEAKLQAALAPYGQDQLIVVDYHS